MKKISHTQTLTAIKATSLHKEDAQLMFPHYLKNPQNAIHILKICGKPQHFHKNNAEGCTIKLHKIL